MRTRVDELFYDYCAPKPVRHFTLWDSHVESPPHAESPEAITEQESIDIHIHLVV